jgi:hypothetical protein
MMFVVIVTSVHYGFQRVLAVAYDEEIARALALEADNELARIEALVDPLMRRARQPLRDELREELGDAGRSSVDPDLDPNDARSTEYSVVSARLRSAA